MADELTLKAHGGPYDGQEAIIPDNPIELRLLLEGASGAHWYVVEGNRLVHLESEVRPDYLQRAIKGRLVGPTL